MSFRLSERAQEHMNQIEEAMRTPGMEDAKSTSSQQDGATEKSQGPPAQPTRGVKRPSYNKASLQLPACVLQKCKLPTSSGSTSMNVVSLSRRLANSFLKNDNFKINIQFCI